MANATLENLLQVDLESVSKLNSKKLKTLTFDDAQARELVDAYYTLQEYRKSFDNQARAAKQLENPSALITWLGEQVYDLEKSVNKALDTYSSSKPIGVWARSITGIGPVITSGLMAHIDITQAPTAGHIWRYAGLDPTVEWLGRDRSSTLMTEMVPGKKAANNNQIIEIACKINHNPLKLIAHLEGKTRAEQQKFLSMRPWNSQLKTLCWKIGESFTKTCNLESDVYGKLYKIRKEYEIKKNEAGEYATQAKTKLEKFKIGKDTDAYEYYSIGKLPPAHIHSRAKRYAVKLFLSHYHAVAFESHYGIKPPKPFAIEILGHAHEIQVPNWPM